MCRRCRGGVISWPGAWLGTEGGALSKKAERCMSKCLGSFTWLSHEIQEFLKHEKSKVKQKTNTLGIVLLRE